MKVILNPILRIFGWSIVSVMQDDTFIKYEVRKYPENCKVLNKKEIEIWYHKQKEEMSRKDFDVQYLGVPKRVKDIQKIVLGKEVEKAKERYRKGCKI